MSNTDNIIIAQTCVMCKRLTKELYTVVEQPKIELPMCNNCQLEQLEHERRLYH